MKALKPTYNCRQLGYDPNGHNCYLSAVEVDKLTNLELVFDDDWNVYESYLADYCPVNPGQEQPNTGGGSNNGEFCCFWDQSLPFLIILKQLVALLPPTWFNSNQISHIK